MNTTCKKTNYRVKLNNVRNIQTEFPMLFGFSWFVLGTCSGLTRIRSSLVNSSATFILHTTVVLSDGLTMKRFITIRVYNSNRIWEIVGLRSQKGVMKLSAKGLFLKKIQDLESYHQAELNDSRCMVLLGPHH